MAHRVAQCKHLQEEMMHVFEVVERIVFVALLGGFQEPVRPFEGIN